MGLPATLTLALLALAASPPASGQDTTAAVDEKLLLAFRLSVQARTHEIQREYPDAELLLRQALNLREEVYGPNHTAVASTLNRLGFLYWTMRRYRDAEPLYERALAINEAEFGSDHLEIVEGLNRLAGLYRTQGRYGEAEPLFARALSISEAEVGPEASEVYLGLENLAGLYRSQGRSDEAEPLYTRMLSIAEKGDGPFPGVAGALRRLARLYRSQGRSDEAEPLYLRMLEITEAQFEGDPLQVGVSEVLDDLGRLYLNQGRYDEAEVLFNRSLAIKQVAWGPGHPEVATTLTGLGQVYQSQRRLGEAEPLYVHALSLQEEAFGPDHPSVAFTLGRLARLYFAQGRIEEAESLLERAVSILDRPSVDPQPAISALWDHAGLLHATERPRVAIGVLSDAIEAVEGLRVTFGGDEEVQAGLLARYDYLYERMVRWQLDLGNVEEALRFSERGRAQVLLNQLAAGQIDLRDRIDPEIREPLLLREEKAQARLAEYQHRITLMRGNEDLSERERLEVLTVLTDSLKAADEEFRRIYREIKGASPLWQDVITRGGRPASLALVQREVVRRNGLLLLYELGDNESYLFVIPPGREDIEVVRLELEPALAEQLGVGAGALTQGLLSELLNEGTREALTRPSRSTGVGASRRISGREMSLRLLALRKALVPERVWERVLIAEEVIVVPDGAIYNLPFETLVTRDDDEGMRYWLDEGPPIRYGPSLTVLANLERRRSSRPAGLTNRGGVLSVSDLIYSPQVVEEATLETANDRAVTSAERFARGSFERLGGSLAALPGTAAETDSIVAAFGEDPLFGPVTVLSGVEGTEAALRSSLGSFRYLHLATHGLVDEGRASLFASLALAPPPGSASESTNDGFLQLHEIYDLNLSEIELAVLSACESNVGATVEGEGVFALSRGFLVAGAQRVIASHWAVDDASTAVLMATFFREVAEAERRAEVVDYARALHTARLAIRNHPEHPEWSDPYYWAPFVLTGKR